MEKRAFITGIGGFVGGYLSELLENAGVAVWGIERNPSLKAGERAGKVVQGDIGDSVRLSEAIHTAAPDFIFHLAGFSSVAQSFTDTDEVFRVNVAGTKNVLEAARTLSKKPRILIVSSSEVYGKPESNPVPETASLNPLTPYGESRVKQEALAREYQDLDIVISRSFNHTGPRQSPAFVVSSFAKQIADIEKGLSHEIRVGNLDAVRDFTDVRDMVGAYWELIRSGKSHEIYNLGSEEGVRIGNILTLLRGLSTADIRITTDTTKLRPADIEELRADTTKYHLLTGFAPNSLTGKPRIPFLQTLEDTLDYWRLAPRNG